MYFSFDSGGRIPLGTIIKPHIGRQEREYEYVRIQLHLFLTEIQTITRVRYL